MHKNTVCNAATLGCDTDGIKLGYSILAVSTITICAKACGLLEKVIIAHFYGTTGTADIYFAVMAIVWSAVFFLRGLVGPSLLPVFSKTLAKSEQLGSNLFKQVFLAVLGVAGVGTIIIALGAPSIIRILLPGFASTQRETASWLLRVSSPGIICLGLMVVTYTCLNARKRFAVSAFGEALLKIAIVSGLLVLAPSLGIRALGLVVTMAALFALLFHMFCLPDCKYLFRSGGGVSATAEFRTVRGLVKPLLIGVAFSHISVLFDNSLASTLPSGQLSCLGYGKKIIDAVLLVGPAAIVTVVYSQLAHLKSVGRDGDMVKLVARSIRFLLYISVPLTCIVITLRLQLVRLLFERGEFDLVSSSVASDALMVYGCGLVAFALESLLVSCFFANLNTRVPVTLGIIFVFVDILLAVVLMQYCEYLGIAAALVLAKSGKVLCLGWKLRKRLGNFWGNNIERFLLKLAVSTVVIYAVIETARNAVVSYGLSPKPVMVFGLPSVAGILAFLGCSYVVRMEESRTVLSFAARALKKLHSSR